MSAAADLTVSEAIDSIVLPPDVVDGLINSALLRLNDASLIARLQSERVFGERVDRMAQHIAIALVCAQVFEQEDDFLQVLAHRPFAQGDVQAAEIGALIVELARTQFEELDIGMESAGLEKRVAQINAAV